MDVTGAYTEMEGFSGQPIRERSTRYPSVQGVVMDYGGGKQGCIHLAEQHSPELVTVKVHDGVGVHARIWVTPNDVNNALKIPFYEGGGGGGWVQLGLFKRIIIHYQAQEPIRERRETT